jgi:hypothetical protein
MTEVLLWGAIGGLVPDLLRVIKVKGDLSKVGGAQALVISVIALVIVGAIAAVVADNFDTAAPTLISSITAGFTGPEVLSRLGGTGGNGGDGGDGPNTQGYGRGRPSILRWWSI